MNTHIQTNKYLNSQYEQIVLGALILRPRGFFEIPWLEPHYFRNEFNRACFESIKKETLAGRNPDTLSVFEDIKTQFPDISQTYVSDLTANIPSATNVAHYATKLKRDYTAFRLLQSAEKIGTIVEDENIDNPEDMMGRVLSDFLETAQEIKTDEGNDINSIIEQYEEKRQQFALAKAEGKTLLGWATGFDKLDKNTEGLQPGQLTIFGGYTSTGKTFAVLNILISLMKQKARCKFVSLEMSRVDILGRMISILTGIDNRKYIKGEITDEAELKKVQGALIGLKRTSLSITDDRTWDRIKLDIIKQSLSGGIDVIFIDYLQMILSPGKSEYELTSMISQDLQQIAKDYNIHIVMLSQVSNDHAKNSSSSDMHGYKGGGTIAASADIAIELVNTDDITTRQDRALQGLPYNVDMIVKKARHGTIGKIPLHFNSFNGQFTQQDIEVRDVYETGESTRTVDKRELPFDK